MILFYHFLVEHVPLAVHDRTGDLAAGDRDLRLVGRYDLGEVLAVPVAETAMGAVELRLELIVRGGHGHFNAHRHSGELRPDHVRKRAGVLHAQAKGVLHAVELEGRVVLYELLGDE